MTLRGAAELELDADDPLGLEDELELDDDELDDDELDDDELDDEGLELDDDELELDDEIGLDEPLELGAPPDDEDELGIDDEPLEAEEPLEADDPPEPDEDELGVQEEPLEPGELDDDEDDMLRILSQRRTGPGIGRSANGNCILSDFKAASKKIPCKSAACGFTFSSSWFGSGQSFSPSTGRRPCDIRKDA